MKTKGGLCSFCEKLAPEKTYPLKCSKCNKGNQNVTFASDLLKIVALEKYGTFDDRRRAEEHRIMFMNKMKALNIFEKNVPKSVMDMYTRCRICGLFILREHVHSVERCPTCDSDRTTMIEGVKLTAISVVFDEKKMSLNLDKSSPE